MTSPEIIYNGRPLEAIASIDGQSTTKETSPPSNDIPSHRHSPSLPADLSLYAGLSPSSPDTTPRSKQITSRHRPSLSDPHSSNEFTIPKRQEPPSPLSITKSSTPQTPELQETPSFNTTDNEAKTPLSDYELSSPDLASANQSQVLELPRSEKDAGQAGGGGKRKTVKAFFSGIKNNVAMR
jgi:hypothetical protein